MEKIEEFIKIHFNNAIKLKIRFKKTEPKEWTSLIVANELMLQYGHLINTTYHNDYIDEKNRNITNIKDELSDVLLQLCYLSYLENVSFEDIEKYAIDKIDIEYISILIGQLIEALMEKEGYRYKKSRSGFKNIEDFIKDRIKRIFVLVFNYIEKNKIDMVYEFNLMLEDANNFLDNYVQENN